MMMMMMIVDAYYLMYDEAALTRMLTDSNM
jgi:hypothetical protein